MNRFFLIIFLISEVGIASGQKIISGFVRDKETGEPLIGASVFIPGTTIGVSTNSAGFYSIKFSEKDSIWLISSYIGYKPVMKRIVKGMQLVYDFDLGKGLNLSEIVVRAPLVAENRYGSNLIEIPVSELRGLPALGGETDLMRTYQLLPGVKGGTEGKAGMYVRGGSNDQNLILLDGSPLYYVNHLGGFTSLFDPEAIKNFRLYKGGFPARFGNRLSSVLDVNLKEGDKNKKQHTVSIGLISGSASSQGPFMKGKASYFVSLRRIWIDLLMRPITYLAFDGASIGYNFYDLNAKISWQANPVNKLFFTLYAGDDKLMLNYKDEIVGPDVKSYQRNHWGNILSVARWEHIFSPRIFANTRLSFTKYRFLDTDYYHNKEVESGYLNIFRSRIMDFGINSDLDYFIGNHWQMKAGVGLTSHQFEPGNSKSRNYNQNDVYLEKNFATASHVWENFAFIENLISTKPVSFNAGGRFSSFFADGKSFLFFEPRLSLSLNLYKGIMLKTSFAEMHQFVHMLENPVAGFSTEFWVPSTEKVPPSSSGMISLGIEKETPDFQAGVEIYKKQLKNLINFKEGEVFQGSAIDWQERIESGTGMSKGFEFFLRKKTGRFTGWISYTLAKADRQFDNINFGKPFPYQFDRRHDLSVVFSIELSKYWSFSTDWVYGSGYPITLALGRQTLISPNGNFYDEGEYYGSRNGFRMRDYHRLDLGFTHTKEKKGKERIWSFSIYNAYNRRNPYYYFYKERRPWQGDHSTELYQASFLPIFPSVSYTIKF